MRSLAVHGSLLIVLLGACAWLTCLVPPLFLEGDFSGSRPYDQQARSLLAGRWDVPQDTTERFDMGGRFVVYFGPTPALLRLPFARLVAGHPGKFAFFSLFGAVVTLVAATLALGRRLGPMPSPILTLALVGPSLVIASRAAVYHEAIAWGSAFALWAGYHCVRYAESRSAANLLACAACGLLASQARLLWLSPAVALLAASGWAALEPGPRRRVRHALAAGLGIAVVIGAALGVHHAKFGSWDLRLPLERHVLYGSHPERLAWIQGRVFLLSNVPNNLYYYLSPGSVRYGRDFPWIHPVEHPPLLPGARLDDVAHMMGLLHVAGALVLLAAFGVAAAWPAGPGRRTLPAILALGLGPAALLPAIALCGRYVYDFVPCLVLAGAVGAGALSRAPRRGMTLGIGILALYNVLAGAALALTIQRTHALAPRRAQIDRIAVGAGRPAS